MSTYSTVSSSYGINLEMPKIPYKHRQQLMKESHIENDDFDNMREVIQRIQDDCDAQFHKEETWSEDDDEDDY